MRRTFDIIMRVVSTLLGVLVFCLGGVWILQGFNLAFRMGPMVGDHKWVIFGLILAILGICQVVWSNNRQPGD